MNSVQNHNGAHLLLCVSCPVSISRVEIKSLRDQDRVSNNPLGHKDIPIAIGLRM